MFLYQFLTLAALGRGGAAWEQGTQRKQGGREDEGPLFPGMFAAFRAPPVHSVLTHTLSIVAGTAITAQPEPIHHPQREKSRHAPQLLWL